MRLTIYSRPGCHLCDEMKEIVHRVVQSSATLSDTSQISVDEIDISNDPILIDRYGLEIPVLMIDGQKVAKYRVSEEELTKMMIARQG